MKEQEKCYVNFIFYPDLCVGCGACVAACLDEHDNLPIEKPLLRRLFRGEQTTPDGAKLTWYSLACLHCSDPACKAACPKGCFSPDSATGTVQLDNANCIGCRLCARACPYQAIVFEADGKAAKCDGCVGHLRQGLLPRCVEACPCRAITVDDQPAVRGPALERLAEDLRTKQLSL